MSPGPDRPKPEHELPPAEPARSPPEDVDALMREAAEVTSRLLRDFPDTPEALVLVGMVHAAQGDSTAALKSWEMCLELDPRRADVYLQMGELAFIKGELERALTFWRKAEEIDRKMAGVQYSLARALMNLRRTEEAVAALEKEIEISPERPMCHYLLGQAYAQLKQYDKARRHYGIAIQLQPDLWNAYYGLATVYSRLGQAGKAKQYRDEFKRLKAEDLAVTIDRSRARDDLAVVRASVAATYTQTGLLYLRRRDPATAERHWLRAAALNPRDARCREHLARLYQSNRRDQEALEVYEQLRKLDPQNPVYCVNAGIANGRLGRFDAAEKTLIAAQQLAPKSSSSYRTLAQLYLRARRKIPLARSLAQKAVRLEPVALNYFVLSEACDKNGDRQAAISALRRAVQLDPDNPTYRRIYERLVQEN